MIRYLCITLSVAVLTFLMIVVVAPRDIPEEEAEATNPHAQQQDQAQTEGVEAVAPTGIQPPQFEVAQLWVGAGVMRTVTTEISRKVAKTIGRRVVEGQDQAELAQWEANEASIGAAKTVSGETVETIRNLAVRMDHLQRTNDLLEAAQRSISDTLNETRHFTLDPSFESQRGHLQAPVLGQILYRFGERPLAELATTVRHRGYTYAVEPDTDVHTINRGIIRYAGELYGHGNVVIVEHDSRYRSIYVYLEQINVQESQYVQAGDVLGQTGSSAPYEGARLYFEIRHGERVLDPAEWLSSSRSL